MNAIFPAPVPPVPPVPPVCPPRHRTGTVAWAHRWAVWWLLLALWPLAALAGPRAPQDLAVLVDPGGQETIATVSAAEASGRFTPLPDGLQAGYTRQVHWLRFTLPAADAGPWWLEVQPAYLDDLRLYEPAGAGFRERRSGDRSPRATREPSTGG